MIAEYRRSLKMPEAEEVFDLIFYRPLAFVFVKAVYRTPLTPNQVTILSMICGVVAGYEFTLGNPTAYIWAGAWYAVANILDCADGQLARLQNSGTPFGRIVDGAADYIASTAIFLGLGIGLAAAGHQQWWLVIAAGVSSGVHAMFFDEYQGEFISTVRGEKRFIQKELDQFTVERDTARAAGRRVTAAILALYLKYLSAQKSSNSRSEKTPFPPELYRQHNRFMIRGWSLLGPTTNRTILIVAAIVGRPEIFLWTILVTGNVWLLGCLAVQRVIHSRMNVAVRLESGNG